MKKRIGLRNLYNILRWAVGLLFIFSGLVKANDPLGLAYKMQEFFEVWQTDLNPGGVLTWFYRWSHHQAVPLALIMITAEVVTGVALLTRWRQKAVLNFLLVLIVFFTFLTAFAYASGKFKNCGCFGDCLPLTPLTSLVKDVGLLLAIIALIALHKRFGSATQSSFAFLPIALALFGTVGFQWYVLRYLPLKDCLPFKINASIAEGMKPPKNAVQDSFDLKFVYQKEGKDYEFTPAQLPADISTYKFIDRKQVLVRKGNAEPAIKGFSLTGVTGADSTGAVLALPHALLLFVESAAGLSANDITAINNAIRQATEKNRFIAFAAADAGGVQQLIATQKLLAASVFSVDNTVVRTAARANPTLVYLQNGIIKDKQAAPRYNQLLQAIK